MRPLLLDGFCGAGGAGRGYADVGFEVVGVDVDNQPEYPFEFRRLDFFEFVRRYGHEFDVIHASPVCKGYSSLRVAFNAKEHERQIGAVRRLLDEIGRPYVIENVRGAVGELRPAIMLCGTQFGLKVFRHRFFESNILLFQPEHRRHVGKTGTHRWPYVPVGGYVQVTGVMGSNYKLRDAQAAMGIDWIHSSMIAQAVPPAYTRFVGGQLLRVIGVAVGGGIPLGEPPTAPGQ